jgi:GR25 family glycosyltransferase involved in LPS biosynthesis
MKAKIITLLGNELSESVSNECIKQASKFDIQVDIFPAIDGRNRKHYLKELGIAPYSGSSKMKIGAYGCMLSHFFLYKLCVELNEPLLILEHDGFLIEPLDENLLNQFDDVLKLDIFNPYANNYNKKIDESRHTPFSIKHDITGIHKINEYGWYTWGAYAYILKPNGAKKIIDTIYNTGYKKADHMLASKILCVSIPTRPLARLHPKYTSENIFELSLTQNLTK